jgi:hypothetical protein
MIRPIRIFVPTWFCLLIVISTVSASEGALTIEPGFPGLDASHLKPYLAHYREYQIVDGQPQPRGLRSVDLQQAVYPDGPGWRQTIAMINTQDTVYDEWRIRARDLTPVVRVVSCRSILHRFEIFGDGGATGVKVEANGGEPRPLVLAMEGSRFPTNMVDYLVSGLPLRPGFEAVFPVFSTDLGPERVNLHQAVAVRGRTKITSETGTTYPVWVVAVTYLDGQKKPIEGAPSLTLWVSDQRPYTIRAQWADRRLELTQFVALPATQ